MEESRMKKVVDTILLGIFTTFCIMGFLLVACNLPIFLNDLFNTTVFENTTTLSFFGCLVLFGYVMKYYEEKRKEEKDGVIMKHIEEMQGLNNFWKLYDYETTSITNKEITTFYRINFIILDKYSITIPIELFSKIVTPRDLTLFDNYINKYVTDNLQEAEQKLIFEKRLEDTIIKYIKEYKTEDNI